MGGREKDAASRRLGADSPSSVTSSLCLGLDLPKTRALSLPLAPSVAEIVVSRPSPPSPENS